jgi:hypothetical protein
MSKANNSSLSVIVPKITPHRPKRHSRKKNLRKKPYRKDNDVNRVNYLHKKKRNHTHLSDSSSHSQQKVLTIPTDIQTEKSIYQIDAYYYHK